MQKPIPNFPGYVVDDQGVVYGKSGDRLKPAVDGNGYLKVTLYGPQGKRCVKVSRLVA